MDSRYLHGSQRLGGHRHAVRPDVRPPAVRACRPVPATACLALPPTGWDRPTGSRPGHGDNGRRQPYSAVDRRRRRGLPRGVGRWGGARENGLGDNPARDIDIVAVPAPQPVPGRHRSDGSNDTLPAGPFQPGPSGSAAPSPPGQSIEATLANLVVRQQDVPNRFTVAPIPGGRSVAGGPTLDLCGGDYPSEDLRVGRLQVAAKDRQGTTTLSTEAVQYESDAATAQAFAEVRSSTADCQFDVSMDLSQGTITSSSITADIDRSWQRTAGVDRLAYRVNETEQLSGEESSTVVVYLKRGPLFIGLYFPEPGGRQMPVEGRDRIPTIVKLFEERLLNTPPGSSSETDRGGTGGGGQGDAGGGVGA